MLANTQILLFGFVRRMPQLGPGPPLRKASGFFGAPTYEPHQDTVKHLGQIRPSDRLISPRGGQKVWRAAYSK